MRWLLDTNVLILLRDGDSAIRALVARMEGNACMSSVSLVELEGGVYRDPDLVMPRRKLVDVLMSRLPVLPFGPREAARYGQIVAASGYSRRKILDRMIAAQALEAEATLVTLNPEDFTDIAGLSLHPLLTASPE